MLLSHTALCRLVRDGVLVGVAPGNINGASIDITLGSEILIEDSGGVIDLSRKESPNFEKFTLTDDNYYDLTPGQFILASTSEIFNLPNEIACEYKLKSSLARSGLNHSLAGWADPGWSNSRLTLELSNLLMYTTLRLRKNQKIGQMVFWKCAEVSKEASYATRGQYNNDLSTTPTKQVK